MLARPWELRDDECELRGGRCVRQDDAHHLELVETRDIHGNIEWARGGCVHRHTAPLFSTETGEQAGRVCRRCWTRLPLDG